VNSGVVIITARPAKDVYKAIASLEWDNRQETAELVAAIDGGDERHGTKSGRGKSCRSGS
jgi:hypothetical protein